LVQFYDHFHLEWCKLYALGNWDTISEWESYVSLDETMDDEDEQRVDDETAQQNAGDTNAHDDDGDEEQVVVQSKTAADDDDASQGLSLCPSICLSFMYTLVTQ